MTGAGAAVGVQVTFDAADPRGLAAFWREVLGYVDQPAPAGYSSWDAFLDARGVPADQRDVMWAVVDPSGAGPRLLFQKVPEAKTAKNRVHLDVNVGAGLRGDARRAAVRQRAEELASLGATRLGEAEGFGSFWITMLDCEGNEFDLQ